MYGKYAITKIKYKVCLNKLIKPTKSKINKIESAIKLSLKQVSELPL
jgi:hypothetical protein